MSYEARPDDEPREAHLWVCSGRNVGHRYILGPRPCELGRAQDNDVVVEDDRASQRHARIFLDGERHVVRDLGSTNGTYVNSQRIAQVPLNDGDLLQIGETIFEYLAQEDATGETARGTRESSNVIPDQLRHGARERLQAERRVPASGAQRPVSGAGGLPPQPPVYQGGPQSSGPLPPQPYAGPYPPQYGGYAPSPSGPYSYPGYYEGEVQEPEEKSNVDIAAIILHVRRIIAPLLPYWPMVVAFAFVGVIAGALHFRLNPPPKEVEFSMILNPDGAGSTFTGDPSRRVNFFGNEVVTRFTSAPVVARALEKIDGKVPHPDYVEVIRKSLTFSRLGNTVNSNQYAGTFEDRQEAFALTYARTHIDTFIDREVSIGLSQLESDVKFFAKEAKSSAKALEQAESAMSAYKQQNADALPDQAKSNYNLLFELKQRAAALEQQIASTDAQLRENRRQLAKTPRLRSGGFTTDNPFRRQIAEVNAQIAAAKAAGKGDQHPEMKRLRQQLLELEQLEQDQDLTKPATTFNVNPIAQGIESQIQTLQSMSRGLKVELREVQGEIDEQETRVSALPKAEAGYLEVSAAYDSARKEHKILLDRLRDAELQLDHARARAQDSQVNIIQEPRLVNHPVGKQRAKRIAIGGAIGVVLAGLLALILVFRSGRLTLGMLFGRDIDLSPLFAPLDQNHAPLPAPGPERLALPAPGESSGEPHRGPSAPPKPGDTAVIRPAAPASGSGMPGAEDTDVIPKP